MTAPAPGPLPRPVLAARGVSRAYERGAERVQALRDVDLALHPGEMLGLVGPSGSGKSTLLFVLAGWEPPDTGRVVSGSSLSRSAAELPWGELAVIPQALGLLDDLTIEENVELPARLAGRRDGGRLARLLDLLDLDRLADRRPGETSLGEQQRAVARALLLHPPIVLADEPTTHQDSVRTERVLVALRTVVLERDAAVVVGTHDERVLAYVDRVAELRDGAASVTD
ncbi:MAG: ABC transporter ATP-binding protein [Streptosporangiaceae bacterium]